MAASISTRAGVSAILAALLLAAAGFSSTAGGQAPIVRQPPSASPAQPMNSAPKPAVSPTKEHLPEWMERHRDLTPQQQQQALQNEPGFRQLAPATQQRMLNRLAQLNAMAPQQRRQVLERAEEMEHLDPDQRQQVRGAMAELGRLPAERRRVVARAFRDLRMMPLNQRQAYLSSEYLHRELSPQERITLGNLMAVEPLLPKANGLMAPPPQ
ncbi:DUF3106 domain-containing protein [Granulicella aggregans]|uniref:DUF3106 domain-containing protein n=1 Tax=Granulicella aggregans TaxID=474949 RepID=UPI0021DFE617|nr:DUF3106 domain-containing protein [Granulicella aggregans]